MFILVQVGEFLTPRHAKHELIGPGYKSTLNAPVEFVKN